MTGKEFRQKCIELRLKNRTLGEIIKALNRPKTSVYTHIKNIPMNGIIKKRLANIRRDKLSEIRKLGLTTQKGVSWKGRHCIEFEKWSPNLVNLIAHIIFDGHIKNSSTMYHNRSSILRENFKRKMRLIYKYEPREYKKINNVITLAYHNVELSDFIRLKKRELFKKIEKLPKELQREFLKAFFDDEGNITFNGKKKVVRGFQHNLKILRVIKNLLSNFGIGSKIDKKYFEIDIGKRENLEKFAQKINFSNGLCVNGDRSNSIWKKSLEKRKILQMALDSYL